MAKKCVICRVEITEEYGKLSGTTIKILDENNNKKIYYVCSECQKDKDWLNKAKIKAI